MPEHPTLPPESSLTPAELSHEVASYIDTLKVQIHALCTTYDIPITPSITDTITAFTDKARAREIPPKALTHLLALFTAFKTAAETNRIPEAQRESLPITATVSEDALSTIPEERGQEVTLDLREVLDSSIAFLEAKAPPTWSPPPPRNSPPSSSPSLKAKPPPTWPNPSASSSPTASRSLRTSAPPLQPPS